jgi:hypothetical protein
MLGTDVVADPHSRTVRPGKAAIGVVRRSGKSIADLVDDDNEVFRWIERTPFADKICSMILFVPAYRVGIRIALFFAAFRAPNVATAS